MMIGTTFLFNSAFTYESHDYPNDYQRKSRLSKKYGCIDESDRIPNNSHYDVYERAPKRPGFQNDELPYRSKSQTYGDTTYHTYDYPQSRNGFQ